ncbi:uncharacterized protein LODBEIA_P51400 [Lodderomyces beijingensis]|uniref:Uncharacterized protein n=1 Tax=Lodderomyces beijingensis TaxID=1775926 RepID=A0ABP0ZRY7_9ASCO
MIIKPQEQRADSKEPPKYMQDPNRNSSSNKETAEAWRTELEKTGTRSFVSRDSLEKHKAFNKSTHGYVKGLRSQGVGVPLFRVIVPSFSRTFLKFRYKSTRSGNDDVDSTFSINVYLYKGIRHRWIKETSGGEIRRQGRTKFKFGHFILADGQPSLCDNWDGKSDALDKKSKFNPLLVSPFKSLFKSSAPKPEYYGISSLGALIESKQDSFGVLNFEDVCQCPDPGANFESIYSVDEDDLVHIYIATVLKRVRDAVEKSNTAAAATIAATA